MGLLARRNQSTALDRIDGKVVEHVHNMRVEATIAKMAMDELSEVHGYSEYKVLTTLANAEALKENASKVIELSAAEMAEYRAIRRKYLEQMNHLTEHAGAKVLRRVVDLTLK